MRRALVGLLAGIVLLAVACGGDTGAGDDTVTVGALIDVTGAAGPFGEQGLRGIELAIDLVNEEGGIDGREVSLVHEDTAFDQGQATSLLRRFAGNDDIVAILGPNSGQLSEPLTPLINDLEVVSIPTAASQEWSVPFGDWVFRVPATNADIVDAVAEHLAQEGHTNVAIMYSVSRDHAVGARDQFLEAAERHGLDVVLAPLGHEDDDVDFSAQLTSIGAADVDAVFCSCLPEVGGPMIFQAQQRGVDVQWASDASFLNPDFYELSQETADGTVAATPYDPTRADEVVAEFVEVFSERHGHTPSVYEAYGYDAAMVLLRAMQTIDGDVTRDAVRDALSTLEPYDGVTGTFDFPDGSGDAVREGVSVVVMRGGEFVSVDQ